MLNRFPAELLFRTANDLDKPTLIKLSQVSRRIHSIIGRITLRDVKLVIDSGHECQGGTQTVDRQLATCKISLSHLYDYTQHIRVRITMWGIFDAMVEGRFSGVFRTLSQLRSLKSLSLSWEVGYHQEWDESLQSIQVVISRVLESILEATNGKLERLHIQPPVDDNWFPSSLVTIRGLKALRVIRDPKIEGCILHRPIRQGMHTTIIPCFCQDLPMGEVFGPLIAANPDIEVLEVKIGCMQRGFSPEFLLESGLKCLTMFKFGGLAFAETGSTAKTLLDLTHLRNLRHIVVNSFTWNFPADSFWDSLRHAQIPLETLVTKQVSLPLIRYLSSFSGLRSLEIRNIYDIPESTSTKITSQFTDSVLPKHGETLQHLSISFDIDHSQIDGWAFNTLDWPPALSCLTELRTLAIHPTMLQGRLGLNAPPVDTLLSSYQDIINTVERMPKIEELTIIWPFMTFRCGNMSAHWRKRWYEALAEVMRRLVGQTGRPRMVKLLDGVYYAEERVDEADEGEIEDGDGNAEREESQDEEEEEGEEGEEESDDDEENEDQGEAVDQEGDHVDEAGESGENVSTKWRWTKDLNSWGEPWTFR